MALTILVADTLRKQVESASKGQNTVYYTAKGQPSYFYVVPAFNDVTTGVLHPAFKRASISEATLTDRTELLFGMYPGTLRNGELLSLPGVAPYAPTSGAGVDYFMNLANACNNGTTATGFHLANNVEWSAVQQLCTAGGYYPNGNTDYGRSSDNSLERGVNSVTGRYVAATGTTTTTTMTGSGPSSWRHNNSPFGIADLCGNTWEWSPGMRLNSYEINVISYDGTTIGNPALFASTDMVLSSPKWYAINGSTGALMLATAGTPTANSVRYASAASGTADYTLYCASGAAFEGMVNSTGANPVGTTALNLCKTHGLFPRATYSNGDAFYLNAGEVIPARGGSWSNSSGAGVFALSCDAARAVSYAGLSARPALLL